MTKKLVLKKYANRRLYDTNKSEYVTLKEVSDLIRQGIQIKVVDAKTKEDVTASILTQIILEEAKNNNTLLPEPVLHMIIQYGDNVLGEFFKNHLQKSLRNYIDSKTSVEDQYDKWLDMGRDMSDMAQQTLKNMPPLHAVFGKFFQPDDNSE